MGMDLYMCFNAGIKESDISKDRAQNFLSRDFVHCMLQHNTHEELALEAIGCITGLDMTPLFNLIEYQEMDDFGEKFLELFPQTPESIAAEERAKELVTGNLEKVIQFLRELIEQLNPIDNLVELLRQEGVDYDGFSTYFDRFSTPESVGNSLRFGNDIRYLLDICEIAYTRGATSVWLQMG